MFQRPTSLAEAFLNAAVKQIKAGKVDHHKGTGNWVARRVAVTAETREGFGMVREFDKRPQRPARSPAKLDDYVAAGMSQGFYELMVAAKAGE